MKAHRGPGLTTRADVLPDHEDALTARLSALAAHVDGEPDPVWQATTRARLVAMAAVRTPEPEPVSPLRRFLAARDGQRSPWRTRLTAGVAGAAAAVTGLATAVALSADARPGDALYGVKRGTEQTQLALAGDARGMTLLGFANTRLGELHAILEDDDPGTAVLRDTLATMDDQTTDGAAWLTLRAVERVDDAPLDALDGWTAGQAAGLGGLLPEMPDAVQPRAGESADLLTRIDERVDALRVALACPSGPATAGTDDLGPVPTTCDPEAPPPVAGSGDPQAPVTGAPGTPGTTPDPAVPGSPGGGTDGEGPGSGSGGGSEGDSGGGPADPEVPTPDLPLPEVPLPDLTPLPSLPLPRPDDVLPGSGTVDPAPRTTAPSATTPPPSGGLLPTCVSLPPLFVC